MPLPNTENYHIGYRDHKKGMGLFTSRKFKAGEFIYLFDYWSERLMPIHATNHSCQPNASFVEGKLIAIADIEAEVEITYDYLQHPIPASPWNFACLCGSPNCQGWISVKPREE